MVLFIKILQVKTIDKNIDKEIATIALRWKRYIKISLC